MKKCLLLCIIAMASVMIPIEGKAGDPCYYTVQGVCVPAGYAFDETPVQCWAGSFEATYYNYKATEQDAIYFYTQLVDPNHQEGNTGRLTGLVTNTVSYQTITINPANCQATITPHAGTTTLVCQAHIAGGGVYCCIAKRKPILRSFYCLAML